jgi:ATP synthase protein I
VANNHIKIFKNLSLLTHIGIMMVLPILASVYFGNLLDKKIGTGNIFLVIFVILGVGVGFQNVYKVVMKDIEKKKKE